jgi:dinuclear metal center YbgI/SA1388 family protein
MILKEVTDILEELAPPGYAEDFDNVGLLVGDFHTELSGILVTLDTLESVVEEALEKKCNLIVSFHPIIFKGLKKLTGQTYVERIVRKAIQNNIAIYSIHTALDNAPAGVNAKICEVLGIKNPRILIPKKGTIRKLTTYVPIADSDKLKAALFAAGAGNIGNYSNCSFTVEGKGSYRAGDNANPAKGKRGEVHYENETEINITFAAHKESAILNALFKHHPYEEVAYEVYALENANQHLGMGMIGELEEALTETDFLTLLKERMKASCIRHSALLGEKVKKIAVLGGSGAFAIGPAKAAGADVLVTSDVKYHQFYEAGQKMVIADIGHYESEQFTKNLLADYLIKKMPNFAISLSESKTNPIKYF